jgi:hypothetical protein
MTNHDQGKANHSATRLKTENFHWSKGWLHCFTARRGINTHNALRKIGCSGPQMSWKTASSPKQLLAAAVFTLGYLQQTKLAYIIICFLTEHFYIKRGPLQEREKKEYPTVAVCGNMGCSHKMKSSVT